MLLKKSECLNMTYVGIGLISKDLDLMDPIMVIYSNSLQT
jgi:hypothetical protein